jgi:predicted GH43/DUF377 family glycosyl hydrolase
MKILKTIDYSTLLEELCEPNYQKFNGSRLETDKLIIVVWRAMKKPDKVMCRNNGVSKPLPTYPYITISGSWTQDEYAGIFIQEKSSKKYHFLKYKHMNAYPAEDPRLYMKNNKIYMSYNAMKINDVNCPAKVCIAIWEVQIDVSNNTLKPAKQICQYILENGKYSSVYQKMGDKIYKNFSHVENTNYYLDGFNKELTLYQNGSDVNLCSGKKISSNTASNLKSYVQPEWKISLTTPTILYKNVLLGVAHIRIKWESLSRNYYNLSTELKYMISNNDVHNSDCYFMSIYKIDCNTADCDLTKKKWFLSKPFLITGDGSERKYFSYNINFPCGISVENDELKIQYGLGDCIFLQSNVEIQFNEMYHNITYDYKDLILSPLKIDILDKRMIIPKLNCPSTIKYLLPKHILLFDLGGSGLKLVTYSFSSNFSTSINLGYWDKNSLPSLGEMVNNKINSFDLEKIVHEGAYLVFSLSGIEKLWSQELVELPSIKEIINNVHYHNMYNLFNIPKHIQSLQMTDSEAHYYGNLDSLISNDPTITNKSNILTILIGTGINMKLSINGSFKHQLKYLWDIKYNGKNIITSLMGISNISDLYKQLKYIVKECYVNIDFTNIKCFVFSGGSSNQVFKDIILDDTNIEDLSRSNNIYLNNDYICPYKGMVYKLGIEKGLK